MALGKYNDQEVQDPSIGKSTNIGNSSPNIDAEKATRKRFGDLNGRVGARIAPVLPHLSGYGFGDDDSRSNILGKQIELEAGNALRYRTCSWQKVESP